MSLIEVSLSTIVKKQYVFKLRAYVRVYSSLIILQLLAILFSLGGSGGFGGGNDRLYIKGTYYSADTVILFTLIWGLVTAIIITTKAYRYDDFSFVANRVSSHLSNILFIITASIIGGICAMLSGFLIKDIIYYFNFHHTPFIMQSTIANATTALLIGIAATSLYVLLISAFGYLVGMLVQFNKIFVVIIPGLFIGLTILARNDQIFDNILKYFYTESSFLIFFLKVILTSSVFFIISIGISNKMEVRS